MQNGKQAQVDFYHTCVTSQLVDYFIWYAQESYLLVTTQRLYEYISEFNVRSQSKREFCRKLRKIQFVH